MDKMPFIKNQSVQLLRIYLTDKMMIDGHSASEYLLEAAKEFKITGASVFHGISGFGTHMVIHSQTLLHLSDSLPVIIEIIDTEEKITGFIKIIENKIQHGLMTTEEVKIAFYKSCEK
jgi:PII-like signaling protein